MVPTCLPAGEDTAESVMQMMEAMAAAEAFPRLAGEQQTLRCDTNVVYYNKMCICAETFVPLPAMPNKLLTPY